MASFNPSLSIEDLESVVQTELQLHPLLEPIDIYKIVFQALCGPSHIIQDIVQVTKSISDELSAQSHPYLPLCQDIGNGKGYARISLNCLLNSKNSNNSEELADTLARWMLASCDPIDYGDFNIRNHWLKNRTVYRKWLPATDELWEIVDAHAMNGTLPSHSDTFRNAYHPHYRLVRLDLTDFRHYYNI